MEIFVLQLILLFSPTVTFAPTKQEVIVLDSQTELKKIGKQIYFLEDIDGKLSIDDIRKPAIQDKFQQHKEDVFNRPASRAVYWFKILLQNQTGKEVWLEAGGTTSCWYIDFYRPDSLGLYGPPVLTGALRPEENKEYRVNFYWLKLAETNDNAFKTYYLRVESGFTHVYPLQAGTLLALSANKELYDYITAGFVGLMLVMIFYNIFLGSATKDNIYLIYAGYLIATVFDLLFQNNYPLFKGAWWWEHFMPWYNVSFFFMGVFAIRYLNLASNAPRLNYFIWTLTLIISVVFPVITSFSPELKFVDVAVVYQPVVIVFYIVLLASGIYLWLNGQKNARFFILGWPFVIISGIVFILSINGILPFNVVTRNITYFGVSIEVLMFSLALADRLNITRNEKELLQAEKLFLIQQQNQVLEEKVAERTAEIHHRIKNNLQIISSLINLKLRNASQQTRDALSQLNGRIFSMGLIHEKLYQKDNYKQIRLDVYLEELCRFIAGSFEDKEHPVAIQLDCEPLETDADTVLNCSLITNELLINSFKHAFSPNQKDRKIEIALKKQNSKIEWVIADNGNRYKALPANFSRSFGLRFVDQLVRSKLQGSWSVKLEKGLKITILI